MFNSIPNAWPKKNIAHFTRFVLTGAHNDSLTAKQDIWYLAREYLPVFGTRL